MKQVGSSFGPSQRLTVDFSNLDASNLNITTGESGNIFSPYYMDHWPAWTRHHILIAVFGWRDQRQKAHSLQLQPVPNKKGTRIACPL